jgi:hypothetical protein
VNQQITSSKRTYFLPQALLISLFSHQKLQGRAQIFLKIIHLCAFVILLLLKPCLALQVGAGERFLND